MINFTSRNRIRCFPQHYQLPEILEQTDAILAHFAKVRLYKGGVLRDHFIISAHNDVDAVVILNDSELSRAILSVALSLPERKKFFYVEPLNEIFNRNIRGVSLESILLEPKNIILRLNFSSSSRQDEQLEITIPKEEADLSPYHLAKNADSPINSFVLDADNNLWAHDNAMDDVNSMRYAPFTAYGIKEQLKLIHRFFKLQRRQQEFSYVPNVKTAIPYFLMQIFDKATDKILGKRLIREYSANLYARNNKPHVLNLG